MTPAQERTRVLMLLGALPTYPGGGERFAVGLATHLPAERYEVVFCTTRRAGGELLDQLQEAGVEHISLERRHRFDVLPWYGFVAMLRQRRFDVLHAHMFGSNVWGTVCGRLARLPAVVAHEQTWSFQGKPLRRILDRELIGRFADAFLAVSSRDMEWMIEIEGVPADKIKVMPNAYIRRPEGMHSDLRGELGIPSSAPLVGTAAVMRPQKALHVLVDAFARVAGTVADAQLLMAGDGPLRPALEQQVRDLGIAERTHFIGYREDVGNVLRTLDVAVMSSDYEGSPLFAFEAMAHETPLVSTDVGAVRDVLQDGDSVMLVPRQDSPALAAAIETLLREPALRQSMAVAASERLTDYEMPVIAARFGELYDSLITAGRQRPRDVG